MDEEKKYLVNIESNLDQYAKEAEEAAKRVEELTIENIKLKASGTATATEIEKSNAALRTAQKDYANAKKSVDLATKANQAQAGSYDQLYRQWQLAQTQLKLMGNAYTINEKGVRILSQRYIEQSKVVANAKKALDQFGRGVNDNRLNVGNYTDSIKAAMGEMQMLPGTLGQAAGGVQRLGVAFKALIANPIVLAITAVIGAITGLVKIFKSTDKGSNELAARFEQLKAILDVLRQRVISLIDAFTHLFRGEFKQAAEDFKNTFGGIGQQMQDATKAAYEYTYALDAVKDSETNYVSEAAKNRNIIAKLEYTAQDRTKSTAERKKALQEALALGEQEVKKQQEFAKARLDAEIKYLAEKSGLRAEDVMGFVEMTDEEQANASASLKTLRNNNEKKFAEIEDLYAKWIDADTKFFEENKRNIGRLTGFEKQQLEEREKAREEALKKKEEAEKKMAETKADLTKELEDYKKYLRERQNADQEAILKKRELEIEQAEWEREQLLINEENLLAVREMAGENIFAIERERLRLQNEAEIDAAKKTGADLNIINEKFRLAQLELAEREKESKLSIYADFAGNVAQIFGEQTTIGRLAAVAQATIATYEAAAKALATYPPPFSYVAMAAAIAAGIANVKKILTVKSGLPGDRGGAAAPTAIISAAPAQRTFAAPVGSMIFTQPTLTQAQINTLPSQSLLTADDIAEAVKNIPAPIVTVEDINAKTLSYKKVEVRGNI